MKKRQTKRDKRIQHLLDNYMDILQHFIEYGSFPIKDRFHMFVDNKWLHYNKNGLLARNFAHEIPADLLAAYWKYRFDETLADYVKLENALEEVTKLL